MEGKLRKHVETLFDDAPPTKKAVELREEMLQNLTEKYRDLLSGGKTEEAAYNIVVAGIGDVSELIKELNKDMENDPNLRERDQKSAMLTAIAVMLFILSPLTLIICDYLGAGQIGGLLGTVILFLFIAAGVGLLIYNNMTKPRYFKKSDTIVEDFKEWQNDSKQQKSMRHAISSALWSLVFVLYFILSFVTHAWAVTWVIFIVGAAVESLITLLLVYKRS